MKTPFLYLPLALFGLLPACAATGLQALLSPEAQTAPESGNSDSGEWGLNSSHPIRPERLMMDSDFQSHSREYHLANGKDATRTRARISEALTEQILFNTKHQEAAHVRGEALEIYLRHHYESAGYITLDCKRGPHGVDYMGYKPDSQGQVAAFVSEEAKTGNSQPNTTTAGNKQGTADYDSEQIDLKLKELNKNAAAHQHEIAILLTCRNLLLDDIARHPNDPQNIGKSDVVQVRTTRANVRQGADGNDIMVLRNSYADGSPVTAADATTTQFSLREDSPQSRLFFDSMAEQLVYDGYSPEVSRNIARTLGAGNLMNDAGYHHAIRQALTESTSGQRLVYSSPNASHPHTLGSGDSSATHPVKANRLSSRVDRLGNVAYTLMQAFPNGHFSITGGWQLAQDMGWTMAGELIFSEAPHWLTQSSHAAGSGSKALSPWMPAVGKALGTVGTVGTVGFSAWELGTTFFDYRNGSITAQQRNIRGSLGAAGVAGSLVSIYAICGSSVWAGPVGILIGTAVVGGYTINYLYENKQQQAWANALHTHQLNQDSTHTLQLLDRQLETLSHDIHQREETAWRVLLAAPDSAE